MGLLRVSVRDRFLPAASVALPPEAERCPNPVSQSFVPDHLLLDWAKRGVQALVLRVARVKDLGAGRTLCRHLARRKGRCGVKFLSVVSKIPFY